MQLSDRAAELLNTILNNNGELPCKWDEEIYKESHLDSRYLFFLQEINEKYPDALPYRIKANYDLL